MNRYSIHIICILTLCLNGRLCAQINFSGTVVNNFDSLPLERVEIFNQNSGSIQISDANGKFIFQNLDTGLHFFTAYAEGFETCVDSFILERDHITKIGLSKLKYKLSGVEILARREELFAIKQLKDIDGTSVFAGKKTEVVIMDLVKGNLPQNNSRQVYAQVSGLNIYEGSDGGLQLNIGGRGLDPNRTSNFNTRQNGYDISADVLGYPESYYTPPSEALSEIRILRGASSLQYGTQFGGLIDFRIRKLPTFKRLEVRSNQTLGSFNSFNSFNSIGFNNRKFSINAFYNFKKGDGFRQNSEYNSHTGFISFNHHLGSKSSLTAEVTYFTYLAKQAGGLTDQQFQTDVRMSTRERNWFSVDWKLFNIYFTHKISKSTTLSLSAFHLNAERKAVGFRGNPINLNENPITALDEKDGNGDFILPRDLILGSFRNFGFEIKSLSHYKIKSKESVFLAGAKYYNANNTSVQGAGSSGSNADFDLYTLDHPDYANQSNFTFPNLNIAFFSENIFYLSKRLSVTPGLRFEHIVTKSNGVYNQVLFDIAGNPIANNRLTENRELERRFLLLGLGISYKTSDRFKLNANISQNYRSVTFSDIRVVSPTFIIDPDIRDEKGLSADIGLLGRLGKIASYELTTYAVLYDDRIGIILDDRANRVRKNVGKAIISGAESLFNLNIGRWASPDARKIECDVFLNTAYTFSEYIASEENNVVGKQVEFVPAMTVKSGFNVGIKQIELSFQYSFVSRQYTDVQNSGKAVAGDIRSGIIGPIDAYDIADITMSYSFDQWKLTAGVNNLFNSQYFTRRATGYPGPGIIPSDTRSFFVTLSFLWSN